MVPGWSSRQLERQISKMYYERLLVSKERTQAKAAIARYSVLNDAKQIFVSKYRLELPTAKKLQHEMEIERKRIDEQVQDKEK